MSKFDSLRKAGTNGVNYGLSTEDVIAKLEDWDRRYGVTINGARMDAVDLTLARVPDDLDAFAAEVYEFCPDTVDQGFGLMSEADAVPDPDDPNCRAQICEGVDFTDPDFGKRLLRNAIAHRPRLYLWWD